MLLFLYLAKFGFALISYDNSKLNHQRASLHWHFCNLQLACAVVFKLKQLVMLYPYQLVSLLASLLVSVF